MKISFLLTSADAMGGTERAVSQLAALLAETHEVEILSVFRTSAKPFFTPHPDVRVRYLVDSTGETARPVRATSQGDAVHARLAGLPSEIVDRSWEAVFNRLSDVELRLALEDTDADAVIATTPSLLALLTAYAPSRVLTLAQEHRVSELRGTSGEPLLQCAPFLDAMVTLTEPTRAWFAQSLGDAAPTLAAIGNPVPDDYRPQASGDARTVLFAGRLVGEKQTDHAVRAFATLADRFPDWRLRILGSGPTERQNRLLANELGVKDQVEFLGSTPDMPEEFAKSSIFLMTSRNEAFPLVLLESLASGVPVVSYACPNGPAEIVTPGSDGLLVAPDDLPGLVEALEALMGDDARRKAYGAAGVENVKRFSGDRIAEQWNELLADLDRARRGPERARVRAERLTALAAAKSAGGPVSASTERLAPRVRDLDQKAQEVRIEAQSGGTLMRSGGLLCRIDDELFPFDVAKANLDLAVAACDKAGIPYLHLRTRLIRHSIAVAAEHREAFVAAAAEQFRSRPVYAALLTERNTVTSRSLAGLLTAADCGKLAALRLFEPTVTSAGSGRLGDVYGCTVTFHEQTVDPETGELLPDVALVGGTVFGPTLPESVLRPTAHATVDGTRYPTPEPFTWTLLDDVDFPIDAVYTWVDGNDPAWKKRRAQALGLDEADEAEGGAGDAAADSARYRDRDELRYSLRSLDMYAPWIRNIYIVTDDQTPSWLDTSHPRVKVVHHRDILGGHAVLPTFNSHAIETGLHRIDGLSEQFLYLNDDVFFGRPLQPGMFFKGSGQPVVFPSPTSVPPTAPEETDDPFLAAAKNNRALLTRKFGRATTNTYLHTPHPLRRGIIREIEDTFAEEFSATARAQFRSATDLAVPSSLHHSYALATGQAVTGSIASGFVNVGLQAQHTKLSTLLAKRAMDVFCLNDYHAGDVSPEEQADLIALFLASYFPTGSQFEKGSRRNAQRGHS